MGWTRWAHTCTFNSLKKYVPPSTCKISVQNNWSWNFSLYLWRIKQRHDDTPWGQIQLGDEMRCKTSSSRSFSPHNQIIFESRLLPFTRKIMKHFLVIGIASMTYYSCPHHGLKIWRLVTPFIKALILQQAIYWDNI